MQRAKAARPDVIRRHNLALVLQAVHLDGPLSRAELTARSGLSRSTIHGLVNELSELALLVESVPVGGTRAGRPSHVVAARADGPYAVAVDVDVARVTAAAVGIGGRVLARHVSPTDPGSTRSPTEVALLVAAALPLLQAQAGTGARAVGIGVSVPGTVDAGTGVVQSAPNLSWQDVPLRELLDAALPSPLPVALSNDADLAVLAEHRRGSARGCTDVVHLLGRVGVGAGILVAGRPLRGRGGLAGEVGHMVVDPTGLPCRCGSRGCVETYISDAALLRLADCPPGTPVETVLRQAAQGESAALGAVHTVAHDVGRTVAGLVNLLNPEVVLLGGSLKEVLLLARDRIEAALDAHAMAGARAMVRLVPSQLGDDSSLLGAAELAFDPLLADPLLADPLQTPAVQTHAVDAP